MTKKNPKLNGVIVEAEVLLLRRTARTLRDLLVVLIDQMNIPERAHHQLTQALHDLSRSIEKVSEARKE